jgi:hypothetical protein
MTRTLFRFSAKIIFVFVCSTTFDLALTESNAAAQSTDSRLETPVGTIIAHSGAFDNPVDSYLSILRPGEQDLKLTTDADDPSFVGSYDHIGNDYFVPFTDLGEGSAIYAGSVELLILPTDGGTPHIISVDGPDPNGYGFNDVIDTGSVLTISFGSYGHAYVYQYQFKQHGLVRLPDTAPSLPSGFSIAIDPADNDIPFPKASPLAKAEVPLVTSLRTDFGPLAIGTYGGTQFPTLKGIPLMFSDSSTVTGFFPRVFHDGKNDVVIAARTRDEADGLQYTFLYFNADITSTEGWVGGHTQDLLVGTFNGRPVIAFWTYKFTPSPASHFSGFGIEQYVYDEGGGSLGSLDPNGEEHIVTFQDGSNPEAVRNDKYAMGWYVPSSNGCQVAPESPADFISESENQGVPADYKILGQEGSLVTQVELTVQNSDGSTSKQTVIRGYDRCQTATKAQADQLNQLQ